ncbi:MAG: COQ9 family protein [Rickettsiales bacterium]|nr:COQ9 family protein [Rickettsiales bacterium]
MDKQLAAKQIIEQALPLVPFEGWTQATLSKAAHAAGYRKTDAIRVFPNGAIEAVDCFMQQGDEELVARLQSYSLDTMKIRARIATAVRLRIELHAEHREALRKAVTMQSLPFYAMHGMKNLYRTVDTIWHGIGDNSTDFNFYTKRLTLAAVYTATVLFWLDDTSPSQEASWAFLDRRIEDVMKIEKAKQKIRSWVA